MKIAWIKLTTILLIMLLMFQSTNCIDDDQSDDYDDTQIDDTEGEAFSDEASAGQTSGRQPFQQTSPPPQTQITKKNKLDTTTKKVDVEVEEVYDDAQSEPVEEPIEDETESIDETANGSEEIIEDIEDDGMVVNDSSQDKSSENADEKMIKELSVSSQAPEYKYPNGMNTYSRSHLISILKKPGILAGIIGGIVIGLLTAILLIMFVVYRMRKKDEGSYALAEDTKKPLSSYEYRNVPTKEFYA